MKYEAQINAAFTRLKFTPRDGQIQAIDKIVTAFLDDGFKTVVLSAPTGVGKSIIAAITAEVLHTIKRPNEHKGASFLLSPTNILSDQYYDTFVRDRGKFDDTFRVIKGAANYECPALSTPAEPVTAEDCVITVLRKTNMNDVINEYCTGCEYNIQKTTREKSRHFITNYAYFFIDRLYNQMFDKRTLCVFDEGHMLNDLFTQFNTIEYDFKYIETLIDDISSVMVASGIEFINQLRELQKLYEDEDGVNLSNVMGILSTLHLIFNELSRVAMDKAERERNQTRYIKLRRIGSKYMNELMKVDLFMELMYEHAFEYKYIKNNKGKNASYFSIKPIFVGEFFDSLVNAEYNLICSATISETYARTTMHLDNATYIKLPPMFPQENKRVAFYNPQNLNYNSMQTPEVINKILTSCSNICEHHIEKGERGIILTPSFVVNEQIANHLRAEHPEYTFIVHTKGSKLEQVLSEFKFMTGPCVMITPSGYEGMDLSGDLSRFQVLVKAPFASLGDARIKHIATKYPKIYSILTIMKLVQGAGRSVRSPEDWAITYMLDTNIERLWRSQDMVWWNEFSTSTIKKLG